MIAVLTHYLESIIANLRLAPSDERNRQLAGIFGANSSDVWAFLDSTAAGTKDKKV